MIDILIAVTVLAVVAVAALVAAALRIECDEEAQ